MISCKLYGRLGNQMFQIAATIAHAKRYGFEYKFPAETLNPEVWEKHPFELPELTKEEMCKLGRWVQLSHGYNEIPARDNLELDGYFQSYRYFEEIIPELRKIFKTPNVTHWNSIAVHVRRGDYLLYPDKHPVLPIAAYYRPAIQWIVSEHHWKPDDFEIIVYSDDYLWCLENFTKENIGYHCHVKFSGDEHPVNDLYAMTMAQDIVIANSSFSYWGAILNPNNSKIVVAPDKDGWFGLGNKHLNTIDLLPPRWNQTLLLNV